MLQLGYGQHLADGVACSVFGFNHLEILVVVGIVELVVAVIHYCDAAFDCGHSVHLLCPSRPI